MKTPYTIPVALLMMAVFLGPASAHADTPGQTFQVKFTYNAKAPAADIYSDLKQTARKACNKIYVRSAIKRHVTGACARQVVDKGVAMLGRTDIAMLHKGPITVASR
ncbi:MAG: hypothetical protein Q8R02_14620 [Hyphomonadaceae bacterium]|nr:hypothetical protein [Hyphomonadaceae bacterium]